MSHELLERDFGLHKVESKSCANKQLRPLEFQLRDLVSQKVSPTKGVAWNQSNKLESSGLLPVRVTIITPFWPFCGSLLVIGEVYIPHETCQAGDACRTKHENHSD